MSNIFARGSNEEGHPHSRYVGFMAKLLVYEFLFSGLATLSSSAEREDDDVEAAVAAEAEEGAEEGAEGED